jgi:hypothetical protein
MHFVRRVNDAIQNVHYFGLNAFAVDHVQYVEEKLFKTHALQQAPVVRLLWAIMLTCRFADFNGRLLAQLSYEGNRRFFQFDFVRTQALLEKTLFLDNYVTINSR